ncbi:alpha/beta hydrolase [Haloferula helveola]|uniref:alpha/beta hydrolase n=1 Tax=Haloferula helveola TaxID=490095 RepID=UPI0030CB19EF
MKFSRLAGVGALAVGLALVLAYDIPGYSPDQIIEYKQTVDSGGSPVGLDLHVFYPEGHQPTDSRPAIVFFFGGGWVSGSASHFHPQCEYLASRGMVAISAEYRVSSIHGTTPEECVRDGKSAIRFVRENAAALGVDPNRIVAAGGSAGGHVAAATGTLTAYDEPTENLAVSSKPNAMVLFNPVYDNGPGGYKHTEVQAYWEDFSPMNNIDATTPPAVVFLGTNDSLIPVATAETFQSLMQAEGIRSDLHLYQDEPHSFFNFDVPGDSSGPFYGYQATVFQMDEFLVSLGYLSDPHGTSEDVTDWVAIFGDAGFSGGSGSTASPVTTDADADAIAANFTPVSLADGQFIRLTGSVTFDAPLTARNFRIGLFDGDDPVVAGDGTGYVGIWSEAPSTSPASILAGDGTGSSHPFETASGTVLASVPAASATVPAGTPVDFSLMIARNGANLDIITRFTDGASYDQEQNLLNQPVANYDFDSVALLMTGNLNATEGSFSNVRVTSGDMLPSGEAVGGPDPTGRVITYVDAVEGAAGNTFATGGTPVDTSWINSDGGTGTDEDQWRVRTGVEGNGDTIFQAIHNLGDGDDMPELTTRITGLSDGAYDIWAFYWDQIDSDTQNWVVSTGLASGSLGSFSSPDEPAVAGATSDGVYNASTLSFTTSVQTVAGGGLRNLFGVYLGKVAVTGGAGVVEVFIDNLPGGGSSNRTWYDGVGYARANDYADWIGDYDVGGEDGFEDDPDGDGNASGLENFLGTPPDVSGPTGFEVMSAGGPNFVFSHPENPTPADDLIAAYQWSTDLGTFHEDGATDGSGTTVSFSRATDTPVPGTTTVTATASGPSIPDRLFVRLRVVAGP